MLHWLLVLQHNNEDNRDYDDNEKIDSPKVDAAVSGTVDDNIPCSNVPPTTFDVVALVPSNPGCTFGNNDFIKQVGEGGA